MYSGFQFYVCILSSRRTMSIAQDLISQIINTKDTCTRRRRKTFSKSRARFWLLLISSSQSNLAIYRSQWYISLMLICLGSWSKFAGYKWVNISLPTKHISQSEGVSGMARDGCISPESAGTGDNMRDHLIVGPGDAGRQCWQYLCYHPSHLPISRQTRPCIIQTWHRYGGSTAWMSSPVYLFIFENFII